VNALLPNALYMYSKPCWSSRPQCNHFQKRALHAKVTQAVSDTVFSRQRAGKFASVCLSSVTYVLL